MKRSPLVRRSPIRRKRKRAEKLANCPACKLGRLVRMVGLVQQVEVCPGYTYPVDVRSARVCARCGAEQISRLTEIEINAKAYAQHRRMILARDGYRCVRCGSTERLAVHHIVFRSRWPGPKHHDPSNLQTLCGDCHDLAHGRR